MRWNEVETHRATFEELKVMNLNVLMTPNSSSTNLVKHEALDIHVGIDDLIRELEALAGRFDPNVLRSVDDPNTIRSLISAMEGEQGLMIFAKLDHGFLFNLDGKKRKVFRYQIGNPLIAYSMTAHDIRAALYAPLSILIYDVSEQVTRVEFDIPSTLFGKFDHSEVTNVGLDLDKKLVALIASAAGKASKAF
jgi:uncharacterized protein (DUF302 family)